MSEDPETTSETSDASGESSASGSDEPPTAGDESQTEGDEPTASDEPTEGDDPETVRVWLAERTFSDDEQNVVILIYATPDGRRALRKERALTSFTGPARTTTAAVDAETQNLDGVDDPDRREQYAAEARRMQEEHAPDDSV